MMIKYTLIVCLAVSFPFVIGSPEPTCPSDGVSFYRDATNCTKFYECNRGHLITLECSDDMYFNEKIRACDYPKFVDCDPVCPYPSDVVTQFYDPKNCSRYYECNRGERVLSICPPGAPYWNHIEKYCDFAEYVDCSRGGSTTSSTITTTSSSSSSTPSSSAPTDSTTMDPSCPYPSNEKTYLVYPYDCSRYYLCVNGKKTVEDCPEGLLFNDITLQCEFSDNVTCEHASTVKPYPSKTSENPDLTTSPTASTHPGTTGVTPSPDPSCSSYPAGEKVSLVYPYDCSKYYLCYNGKKSVESCPEGLFFDDVNSLCKFREDVTCAHASTLVPYPITTSEKPDITTSPTSSTHPGTTGVTPSPDPTCRSYPAGEKVSLVYPYDCSKYYLCYNGKKSVESCPEGLFFDDVNSLCRFREDVTCAHASTLVPYPITTSENPDITTSPTTSTHPGTTGVTSSPDPSCSSYPAGEKVSLVYPYDCSKYYLCYNGQKSVESCPEGLFFDDVNSVCNFREDVTCAHASTVLPYPITNSTAATISTVPPSTTSGVPTRTTTPIPNTTSKGDICKDEPSGTMLSDPDDCASYFECSNDMAYHFTCPVGTLWDKDLKECAFAADVIC